MVVTAEILVEIPMVVTVETIMADLVNVATMIVLVVVDLIPPAIKFFVSKGIMLLNVCFAGTSVLSLLIWLKRFLQVSLVGQLQQI